MLLESENGNCPTIPILLPSMHTSYSSFSSTNVCHPHPNLPSLATSHGGTGNTRAMKSTSSDPVCRIFGRPPVPTWLSYQYPAKSFKFWAGLVDIPPLKGFKIPSPQNYVPFVTPGFPRWICQKMAHPKIGLESISPFFHGYALVTKRQVSTKLDVGLSKHIGPSLKSSRQSLHYWVYIVMNYWVVNPSLKYRHLNESSQLWWKVTKRNHHAGWYPVYFCGTKPEKLLSTGMWAKQ